MSVNDSDQLVAEAAARLQKAFDWIDISTGDGADFRVVAAVALGITPAQVDVEECMGLGWADE